MGDSIKGKLLPFYLVIDVSASMQGGKLESANRIVPEVADTIAKNPIIADKVRFSMIDFSDDARVVLPMCDLLTKSTFPLLATRGSTSYAAAFNTLRTTIESDVKQLKADGYEVHRPAVFFVSDGEPTDGEAVWKTALSNLCDYDKSTKAGFAMFPNMIPFGVDSANPKILGEIVHPKGRMKLYMATGGDSAGEAISRCAEVLVSTILKSGSSIATEQGGLVLPDASELPPGIDEHDDWI